MDKVIVYTYAMVIGITLSAVVLLGIVAAIGTALWATWNHSAAHVPGLGPVGWTQSLWFVGLAEILQLIVVPNTARNLVSRSKSSNIHE